MLLRHLMPKIECILNRAHIVRFMFRLSYYFFFLHNFVCNNSLQVIVWVRGLITGRLAVYQLVWTAINICVWMYEDTKLLKILKEYSEQHYEIAELLQIRDAYSSVHLSHHEKRELKKQEKKKKKREKKLRKRLEKERGKEKQNAKDNQ